MSLSAHLTQQFYQAAEHDPSLLQKRFEQNIELETFRQILEPINDFLDTDVVYSKYRMSTSLQMEALRQMCLEAYAAHSTNDETIREGRLNLLNTLQSLKESIAETEKVERLNAEKNIKEILFVRTFSEDYNALSHLSPVIQEAADIHGGFLHTKEVAPALEETIKTLDAALENKLFPFAKPSANDESYNQTFQKASTSQVAEPNSLAENDAEHEQHNIA